MFVALAAVLILSGLALAAVGHYGRPLEPQRSSLLPASDVFGLRAREQRISGATPILFTSAMVHERASGTRILGLPPADGWALIGAVLAIAAFIAAWTLLRARRRSPIEETFDSAGRLVR
jgi:hypothetical protein